MWQRFTENARKVVFYAQEEARALGENFVGPEHLLLALMHGCAKAGEASAEEPSTAVVLFQRLGVDIAALYAETATACSQGSGKTGQDMQLTLEAKKIIDFAYDEAKQFKHSYIGTEHLLLGLLRESQGIESAILNRFGVTLEAARLKLPELLADKAASKERLLTLDEAVKFLGTSRPTLYRLLGQDEIKGLKVGRQWRFRKADLVTYMERGPAAANAAPSEELDRELEFFAAMLGPSAPDGTEQAAPDGAGDAESKTAALAQAVLRVAVQSQASDIHLEPTPDDLRLRLRLGGGLVELRRLPPRIKEPLTAQFKMLAGMNPGETRLPQEGRFLLTQDGAEYDVRVSTLPAVGGEAITLRIFDRSRVPADLEDLGLTPENLAQIDGLLSAGSGLIVVASPAGEGKTTLLYCCLQDVASAQKKTLTVEDSVESVLPDTTQVVVSAKTGLTAAAALRAFLSQDPDTIMVVTLGDPEAATLAADAARAGHLVLCGLEAHDAASALVRLRELGLEPARLTTAVKAVVAVRLCRRLCEHCKAPADPAKEEIAGLINAFVSIAAMSGVTLPPGDHFFEKRGCERCRWQGFLGDIGLCEILPMTERVAEAVLQNRSAEEIMAAAIADGMQTQLADGYRKAAAGLTTLEEALSPPPRSPLEK